MRSGTRINTGKTTFRWAFHNKCSFVAGFTNNIKWEQSTAIIPILEVHSTRKITCREVSATHFTLSFPRDCRA